MRSTCEAFQHWQLQRFELNFRVSNAQSESTALLKPGVRGYFGRFRKGAIADAKNITPTALPCNSLS
jgi:hypothetical protein